MTTSARACSIAISIVIASIAVHAVTLVDFDARLNSFAPIYLDVQRTADENNRSNTLFALDITTPLFNDGPVFYGGLHMANSVTGGTFSSWRNHRDLNNWPNKAMVFFASNDDSGGGSFNEVNVIYLWLKANFVDGDSSPGIVFVSSNELRLTTTSDWYEDWRAPASLFRFIVRDGGQYYVSEATNNAASTPVTFVLTNFSNNSAAGFRWAPVTLTGTSFDMPDAGSLTFAAYAFSNVTAVGWIGRGSGAYYRNYGFDTFKATGELIPEPVTALGLAALLIFCRRRGA